MSEVYGTGYGTSHDWRRVGSSWGGPVRYRCRRCGAAFDYNPTHQANLPRTIETSGVPDECPRRTAQNHNEGRAAWHR